MVLWLAVLLLGLAFIIYSGKKDEKDRGAGNVYLSRFIEGEYGDTRSPTFNHGRALPIGPYHSGYQQSENGFVNHKRARVLGVFKNQAEDFHYAGMIPYTMVVGWATLSSNAALRGIKIHHDGRSFVWEPVPGPEKPQEDGPCTEHLAITQEMVDDHTAVVNILWPVPGHKSSKDLEKLKRIQKGDTIEYAGLLLHLLKDGDPEEMMILSHDPKKSATGPSNPTLISLSSLSIVNRPHLADPVMPRSCAY